MTVVFSVDAELWWGYHDIRPLPDATRRRLSRARERWRTLVELFDTYDVRATWAVVGHLLTSQREYRAEHPLSDEWFGTAAEGIERQPDDWLAIDLVDLIGNTSQFHEIASHGFSHAVFSDIDRGTATAECQLSMEIAREYGFEVTSFVFPRNAVAHLDVLAESGYLCYRGRRPARFPTVPGARGLSMLVGSKTGTVAPPAVTPSVDEYGLVNVPASMYLGGFRGCPWSSLKLVGDDPAVTLAKNGIDSAFEEGRVFHLWLHPHDLTNERYVNRVRDVLEYVDRKRQSDGLRVATMGEIAAETLREDRSIERSEWAPRIG